MFGMRGSRGSQWGAGRKDPGRPPETASPPCRNLSSSLKPGGVSEATVVPPPQDLTPPSQPPHTVTEASSSAARVCQPA